MGLLVALSIAIYNKAFDTTTTVTVDADQAGLQLPKFGDVRMHGVIVGQIRNISNNGHQAVITLGLDPAAAKTIPANVGVQIVPTTLFGQKYVQFTDPTTTAAGSLTDGTVIPASRVQTSVELETILADLFPLLRAIRPQDLDVTLHALSSGLMGRGDQFGAMMSQLDAYLTTFNVHLPTLDSDLQKLAVVTQAYGMAAPDLVTILKNATTTANTITDNSQQFGELLGALTNLGNDSAGMLETNGAAIVKEARLGVPLLGLLDRYSPEYPCLLEGLDKYTDNLSQIFQHSRVSQTMILSGTQQPAYTPAERPVYGDVGHGPWCFGLPAATLSVPGPHMKINIGTDPSRFQ